MSKRYLIDVNEFDLFVDENNFNDWKTWIEKCLNKWNCQTHVFDDYVSEMFIVLCKCFKNYKSESNTKFSTFAYASMKNKFIDLEKQRKKRELNVDDSIDFDLIDMQTCDSDIDIVDMFKCLSEEEKTIVSLLMNGMTHRQIIATGVVNFPKKLQSIRTKIQKYMEE